MGWLNAGAEADFDLVGMNQFVLVFDIVGISSTNILDNVIGCVRCLIVL